MWKAMIGTELPPREALLQQIREAMRVEKLNEKEIAKLSGIDQSNISRILDGSHGLDYEEARLMLEALASGMSHIPKDVKARDMASENTLEKAHLNDSLASVAQRMFEKGYSQLPVFDGNEVYVGMISEMSALRFLLSPKSLEMRRQKTIEELTVGDLREVRISHRKKKDETEKGEAYSKVKQKEEGIGFLEAAPVLSPDDPLRRVATELVHHYAVLLGREHQVEGIVTRADFLKLDRALKKD
jgi:predicted transcriptional regulator